MTDVEVICSFMEDKPDGPTPSFLRSGIRWWRHEHKQPGWVFVPVDLDLDALWRVEELLSLAQRTRYIAECEKICVQTQGWVGHTSVTEKIQALAAVLRNTDPDV